MTMNDTLCKQLALDFCLSEDEIRDKKNHVSVFVPRDGRRRFADGDDAFKVAVVTGKLIATGRKDVIDALGDTLLEANGSWFFDGTTICRLNAKLADFGLAVAEAHPFYIADKCKPVDVGEYSIVMFDRDGIERFRGDDRFDEAFAFREFAPDVLGVAAVRNGVILGMAGASADSDRMWQIGINVLPGNEGQGIGTALVSVLRNRVLTEGRLPFYGTAMSHLASQRVAMKSGFVPAWAELYAKKIL